MQRSLLATSIALLLGAAPATSTAAEPAEGQGEVDTAVEPEPEPEPRARLGARKDQPWIRRWAPENNTTELGLYGGLLLPSPRVELFEADFALPDQGYRPFARVAPDIGLRLGYFPVRWFGVEAEGGAMPTRALDSGSALLWTARGALVGQLALGTIAPFVLIGGGLVGVSSDRSVVGDDVDVGLHVGGGVKVHLGRFTHVRVDVRDVITARRGYNAGVSNSPEILLGLGITLGRQHDREQVSAPPPPDHDGDGIIDAEDDCAQIPGVVEYQGCPIPDSDNDSILDPDDDCKDVAGVSEYRGCPIPDSDGDGILDPDDDCKDVAGVSEYRGCPIPDSDGDGILDDADQCESIPETINGYEDTDGCPDAIPQEVSRFTGVIDGIYFDSGRATIRAKSTAVLTRALEVLVKYPSVRVQITGHTDDVGAAEINTKLSQARADSVKQFLVDGGVDPARIVTRGAGSTEPIADNKTKKGRAKNRRIEFKLDGAGPSSTTEVGSRPGA